MYNESYFYARGYALCIPIDFRCDYYYFLIYICQPLVIGKKNIKTTSLGLEFRERDKPQTQIYILKKYQYF